MEWNKGMWIFFFSPGSTEGSEHTGTTLAKYYQQLPPVIIA